MVKKGINLTATKFLKYVLIGNSFHEKPDRIESS